MERFKVFSGTSSSTWRMLGFEPAAPDEWTPEHCRQRHNTLRHITALCPENDVSARIVCCGPTEECPDMDDPAEFEVCTEIEIVSGRIGVYGWPSELQQEYAGAPWMYSIQFTGHALGRIEADETTIGCKYGKRASSATKQKGSEP